MHKRLVANHLCIMCHLSGSILILSCVRMFCDVSGSTNQHEYNCWNGSQLELLEQGEEIIFWLAPQHVFIAGWCIDFQVLHAAKAYLVHLGLLSSLQYFGDLYVLHVSTDWLYYWFMDFWLMYWFLSPSCCESLSGAPGCQVQFCILCNGWIFCFQDCHNGAI